MCYSSVKKEKSHETALQRGHTGVWLSVTKKSVRGFGVFGVRAVCVCVCMRVRVCVCVRVCGRPMKAGPFQASSGVQQARCSRHPSHNQPTGKPTSSSLTIEALEQKLTHSSQLSKYLTRRDTAPRVAPENVVSCCTLGRQAESANKLDRKGKEGELEGRRAGWGRPRAGH